jgi:hypothetical protein
MKVAPVIADEAPSPETSREVAPAVTPVPKSSPSKAKRADLD